MKRILVRVLASNRPPHKLQIRPGTAASDVLAYLKLDRYVLIPAANRTSTKEALKDLIHKDEDLYARVEDGAKLIALPAEAVARIAYKEVVTSDPSNELKYGDEGSPASGCLAGPPTDR
jgi:hypothetical protein